MSKKIDISNYEFHAMDYLEGTLSEELKAEFEAFLLMHPEIAEELEEMREMDGLIANESIAFDKEALKMQVHATADIDESNYDSYMIAEVEGNLVAEDTEQLDAFITKNPSLGRDRALYQQTRLEANQAVVYPERRALYQAIPIWESARVYAYRAAAVLVIALGSVTVWNMMNQEVYMPRNNAIDFSTLDQMPAVNRFEQIEEGTPETTPSNLASIASVEASPARVERVSAPSKIETLDPKVGQGSSYALNDRELMAYQPSVSDWVGDPAAIDQNSGSQSLNLAQFVGKKLFGLEPKQSETTKDLIRGGLIKTIDDQEAFAFKASDPNDDKRSMQFLAGNFEFRRVSQK